MKCGKKKAMKRAASKAMKKASPPRRAASDAITKKRKG